MSILPGRTSPRRILRAALKARLIAAQTAVGTRWLTNRTRPYQQADSPAGTIYTLAARPQPWAEAPRRTLWTADIAIELFFSQTNAAAIPDDELDDLEQQVREAIGIDRFLGLVDEDVVLRNSYPTDWEVGMTRQGNALEGSARLTWTWEYITEEEEGSPSALQALETVGLDWDLREGEDPSGDPIDAADVVELPQTP